VETIRALDAHIGVIIRVYDGQVPGFYPAVLSLLRAQRRPTLIGGRIERAEKRQGQHVPQWQRPRQRGIGQRLSMSVHNNTQAVRARRAGADMVFVSPLYPTQSHPGAAHLGPMKARTLARKSKVPAFALGGIDMGNAARCGHGFSGFGAISALLLAP
jgi:thiamine-phosphate pyrophosphorylase